MEGVLHPELSVTEGGEGVEVKNQGHESREEPGVPAARTHLHMSHKERVVVGCMVFLGVVLGSLLMHGAVTSVQEGSMLFFVMNIGGFIGIIAIAALLWNFVALARMRRRELAQIGQPALQGIDHKAAIGSNKEPPPTNIGGAELGDDTTGVKMQAHK